MYLRQKSIHKKIEKMTIVGVRKCLVFILRSSWRSVCQHPFVVGQLLFMLFLYRYFPSIFVFVVYSSPVIACTALLLGALLVYGEPYIPEPEDVKSVNVSVKAGSLAGDVLKKGERCISEDDVKKRRAMRATKDVPFKRMHDDGGGKDNTGLTASSSSKTAEKEIQNEKTVTSEVEAHDLEYIEKEVFSIENPAERALRIEEGLKVEIKKPLENQFESSLGSPWQQVTGHDVSSDSESDGSSGSDGEESLSPDTSMTDIVPIIDELHPLLESENPPIAHRSIDTSDAISRASSPEREFDEGSGEEETENQADEEEEEDAQEEKDTNEAVLKWTADDQKNLMDLGSSELERNQRLENLIAKRRARKLQRFQTDKNLIDLLDTEPLPFMEEISKLNVQVPAISVPRGNPFDMSYDSEESMGLPPIPGSAPSVLLPRKNPFDLPYYQNEESGNLTGESSRPYVSMSQRDTLPMRIERLNLGAVSDDVSEAKEETKLKPYFVAEKMSGTGFVSFEKRLSEKSDSEESSASESDSASAVVNQDHELSEQETHERASYVNQDVDSIEQESDSSVEVGSINLEQEHNGADAAEKEFGEVESSSPVSSIANLEVIDERYDGSSSSSCSEEDKYNETSIHIEPINSAHTVGESLRSSGPMLSVVKPGLPGRGAEGTVDSQVAEPGLSGKEAEGADDSQVADPVYDSSPSANSVSYIPSLDEALFSKVKGKEGFSTGSSLESDMQANLLEVVSTPKTFEKSTTSEKGDFILARENMSEVPHNYIEGVGIEQENVVEKVKGLDEISDEVHAKLRDIKSVNEVSDSGRNIVENFHVEELMSDSEQSRASKRLDNRIIDSCTEKQDAPNQFQFPVLRSDDAGISVNQQSDLNISHDQHSAMEQPRVLESDAGSSMPFVGNLEMKNAVLRIPEPFVDRNETAALSTTESIVGNSEKLLVTPQNH